MFASVLPSHAPGTGVRYYGWRIVGLAAVTLGMSAPGQTVGVSAFIDPMMDGLGITRTQVSTAYLVGTLGGALTMPWFGRLIDSRGVRFTMTAVAVAFAGALAAMAGVTGVITLALGFVGIRMLGQGALGLVSTTAAAYWFESKRGTALGITAAGGQTIMSIAPLGLAAAIVAFGWRGAWLLAAVTAGSVTLLIARLGIRDNPSDVGQRVDGQALAAAPTAAVAWGATRAEAIRTVMFWAITGGVVATGMLTTALGFHQVSILGEQGLTPLQAVANFIPQTVAGLIAVLGTGALVDRIRPRTVLALSMSVLSSAILVLPLVSPGWSAALYGAAIGAAGGSARSLEAAAFPRFFGTLHVGSIRGLVMAAVVTSTAFGPILLALGYSASGSYLPVLRISLVLPIAVALVGMFAPAPPVHPSDRRLDPATDVPGG